MIEHNPILGLRWWEDGPYRICKRILGGYWVEKYRDGFVTDQKHVRTFRDAKEIVEKDGLYG